MTLLRNIPQYEYIKFDDVPGNVQLVSKMSVQDNLVMYKPEVTVGNKLENVEACQRAYLPELTKINRNVENAAVKEVIKYEPVITPFEIWTNNQNDNYPEWSDEYGSIDQLPSQYLIEEKENNFSQMDVMILTTWLKGYIDSKYEIVYFSRIYNGIKRLILVLMRNNEVYPMNIEEAFNIQMLVDKYSFSDKALLIDLRDNLILDSHLCYSRWLSSIVPFLEMVDVSINGYHVITSNILLYNEIYDTLMENIIDMWHGGYLVAVPLYHRDVINKWKLIPCEVDIDGVNSQLQILVHPNWCSINNTNKAGDNTNHCRIENKLALLERQLSGDLWIDIKMSLNDNTKHVIALYLEQLDVVFKYYEYKVFFQCDNYDEMVNIINGMENVAKNYTGNVTKTVIIDADVDIPMIAEKDETIALYYDYDNGDAYGSRSKDLNLAFNDAYGKVVLKWSLMKI